MLAATSGMAPCLRNHSTYLHMLVMLGARTHTPIPGHMIAAVTLLGLPLAETQADHNSSCSRRSAATRADLMIYIQNVIPVGLALVDAVVLPRGAV